VSDERNFEDYRGSYAMNKSYITFREYVNAVMKDSTRGEDLRNLIKFFGIAILEQIAEGKRLVEANEFLKGLEGK
jgi:hypothetical protein